MLPCRDGMAWWLMSTCFLQTWNLAFTRKCLICTPESFFLVVWESGVCWTNSDVLPCAAAEIVALLQGSPLATEERYCIRLFGHLSGYGPSTSFEGQPALGQILMVPLCYLGTSKHQKRLSVPSGLCTINWRTLSTGLCLCQWNELSSGGPQLRCRKISWPISGNRMCPSSILSFMAKGC